MESKAASDSRSQLADAACVCSLLFVFDDAANRADCRTLRRIVVADTFNTGHWIDYINIAFRDRFGRTFGQAGAARNAVIKNFHSHGDFSFEITIVWGIRLRLLDLAHQVN
jgi:hypothetical protein